MELNDNDDDTLVPPYDSVDRRSTIVPATFNLVATIVGGGVLSLPLAFEHCGIALATVLMIASAYITIQSLHLLTRSGRLTGTSSYGEVGRVAFGEKMELFISGLLLVFLLFVIVAYMVLLRDIWGPLVSMAFDTLISSEATKDENEYSDLVLFILILILSPFLVQTSLHALRFNCYVGFLSVSILCVALCHHGFQKSHSPAEIKVGLARTNISDILFALPIILLSFLSHFNVLPIQSNLVRPSRGRMALVVNSAVISCLVLMYLFGLGGYLYAGETTEGNILLNLVQQQGGRQQQDWMFIAGRIGCGVTILLATPIMTLPCRASFLELIAAYTHSMKEHDDDTVQDRRATESTSLLRAASQEEYQPQIDTPFVPIEQRPAWFYGSTFAIVLICYVGAVAAPGVAVVWSICGSSMAFLIAFILPSACYLKLGASQPANNSDQSSLFCWTLLVLSTLAALACTLQTLLRLV